MRKFLIAVVLMLGVFFILTRLVEMQAILETLQRGDWRYIFIALIIQGIWFFVVAGTFRAIYRAIGINERLEVLVLTAASANFTNIVAPSAGVSGAAIFITQARKHGYSTARATVAGALFILSDYLGFLFVLALGLVVLVRRNNLTSVEIVASSILVSIALVLAILLYLGMKSERSLSSALAWMSRLVNKLVKPMFKREYLSEKRAREFARDAALGLQEIRERPQGMLQPILFALINKGLLIAILWCVFLAFKVPVSSGTLIAGFSVSYLFMIVSPTPAGIGVVEGFLTVALSSMYVPLSDATVITLAYRGITFWIPLFIGMLAFRWTSRGDKIPTAE